MKSKSLTNNEIKKLVDETFGLDAVIKQVIKDLKL